MKRRIETSPAFFIGAKYFGDACQTEFKHKKNDPLRSFFQ